MGKVVQKECTIINELGLHARPASMLVKTANNYDADIFIEKDGDRVNGKSIMGVMMLAASQGTKIRIIADGDDASEAVSALEDLLVNKFGEA